MAGSEGQGTRSRLRLGILQVGSETGELRKPGIRLHLPPQPVPVLMLRESRTGEIVTRDKIRHKFRGRETFVDFELGLNQLDPSDLEGAVRRCGHAAESQNHAGARAPVCGGSQ